MDPPTALHFLFPGSEPAAVPSTPRPLSFTHQIWSGTPSGGRLSLQQAATLEVLHLVGGAKHLDGLVVDQGPEVLEGDVLAALDLHLLQEAVQPAAALRNLRQETGSDTPSYRCVTGKKTPPPPSSPSFGLCSCATGRAPCDVINEVTPWPRQAAAGTPGSGTGSCSRWRCCLQPCGTL